MKQQHSRKTLWIIIGSLVIIGAILCIFLAGFTKENSMSNQTASGIRYTIITAAAKDARQPKKGNHVIVHYTGWLSNNGEPGQKFDSSLDRHEPFTFILGVGQVIKGWDESVANMKVGEKRRVIIPPELAYGNRAIGKIIPANSTLIFDIELLQIAGN